jgi:SAM-dependent methyltransferase
MDRDDVAASAAWFETVYRDAAGDPGQVRWADGRPNPMLVSWLNSALAIVRPGARAVVVGCGLGDDVAELLSRGYDAVGFDVSPTAVQWARERFPEHADAFLCADLFNLPARFRRRFDLVVEIYTLQSLHPTLREEAGAAVAELVSGHGVLLTICRARKDSTLLESVAGPPWPLCVAELTGLMEAAGLHPLRAPEEFMDDESPPVERLRCAFCRA